MEQTHKKREEEEEKAKKDQHKNYVPLTKNSPNLTRFIA